MSENKDIMLRIGEEREGKIYLQPADHKTMQEVSNEGTELAFQLANITEQILGMEAQRAQVWQRMKTVKQATQMQYNRLLKEYDAKQINLTSGEITFFSEEEKAEIKKKKEQAEKAADMALAK